MKDINSDNEEMLILVNDVGMLGADAEGYCQCGGRSTLQPDLLASI